MSKFLQTAAVIVGVVAISIATAGALAAPGSALAASLTSVAGAVGLSSATALATVLGAAAAVASFGAMLLAPKPSSVVNPTVWKADPQAPILYAMGRTMVAGQIIFRDAWGADNRFEGIVTHLSGGGPHQSIDTLLVDNKPTGYGGDSTDGAVAISDYGKMFVRVQLGACPEQGILGFGKSTPPTWGPDCKMSGMAASTVTFVYDVKGGNTFTTEPQVAWVGHWAKIYDPRKDDTYPGGSGAHRVADESTWTWSDNPALHALTWLIGRRQNGKLVLGVGMALAGIIMPQYVEAANVADANGWKIGGVVSSIDDRWNVLKQMLQAGGAEPVRLGAQLGCIVNAPKVSLATIGVGDVIGDASVQATQGIRDRINAIVPRCRFEDQAWEMDSASPVIVDAYVTFDGKQRRQEKEYTLVQCFAGQQPTQAVQLARYDIENGREFGPITLPLKLRWMGYRPGDVVTANLPELGLVNQDILITSRSLSPQDATVTITARSETAGKHAFALGQTGTPPATPSVTGPALVSTPAASAWSLIGGEITSDNGTTQPVLRVTGSADSDAIEAIVFEYRESVDGLGSADAWQAVSTQPPSIDQLTITGVKDQTAYQVAISYRRQGNAGGRLILGPATAGQTAVPWQTGVVGPGKPQDGATVGAPAGTEVAGRDAQQLLDDLDATLQAAHDLTTEVAAIADVQLPDVTGRLGAIEQTALPDLRGELHTVSLAVDGAASAITTLQDQNLDTDTRITGLGTSIRQAVFADGVDAEAALEALLAGDATAQRLVLQLASIQSQLTTTIVTGLSAEASARLALVVRMGAAAAAILDLQTTTATQYAATTDRLTTAESAIGANDARIATEEQTRADAVSAQASRTDGLSAIVGDPNTGLAKTRADLVSEITVRADAVGAQASRIDGLSAQVNDGTTGLPATRAQIATNAQVSADADTANAQSISTLSAQVNDANTGLPATRAQVAANDQASVDRDSANAQAIQTVNAQLNDPNTGLAKARADVSAEQQARVDGDGANASSIQAVSATVDGHTATIAIQSQAIATLDGKTRARLSAVVDAGGAIAGVQAVAQNDNGDLTSNLALIARAIGFWLQQDDGTLRQAIGLATVDGQLVSRFYGKVIADNLAINAAVVPLRTAASAAIVGNSSAPSPSPTQTALSLVVHMPVPGWIEVQAFGQQGYSGTGAYNAILSVNGTQIPEGTTGGAAVQNSFLVQGYYYAAAAGDYTVTYSWNANATITLNQRSLFVKGYTNTQ